MPLRHRKITGRPAFTLVEMLVAMALILFIMVILSEAFVAGLESFRQLKAIGDMEERLRTAAVEIRRDLNADHFEGRRRLSDANFWFQPAREGFFQIVQATSVPTVAGPYFLEGQDDVGNNSYRATDHRLHFTVKLRGNQQDKFFRVSIPGGINSPLANRNLATTFFNQPADGRFQDTPTVYNSPWAEVAYFLVPTGTTAGSGVPLFSLYRSQLVVVPDNRQLNWLLGQTVIPGAPVPVSQLKDYLGFSCEPAQPPGIPGTPGRLYFNCPSDLAKSDVPNGPRTLSTANLLKKTNQIDQPYLDMVNRSTLLLTDVISFQVRILTPNAPDFIDLPSASAGALANFDTGDPAHFTSPAQGNANINFNILAVQVTLRVWDIKTEQARQITIVQDM